MAKFLRNFLVLAISMATSAQADTNVLVIVDGSNSMWGQIDGVAKIETAKRTLVDLVGNLSTETKVGLMAYGHNTEGDCEDVEILSAIGSDNRETLASQINVLQPKGKTPIAYSLNHSIAAFADFSGQNNHVVLVSDGVESCGGDPCAAAQSLRDAGLNVTAHVVGFGLNAEQGGQLECIANNTGGQYFDAADTAGFDVAIKQVAQIAEAAPVPEAEIYFEDSFEGDALSVDWEVVNEDLDQYIVENGELLLLATDVGGLSSPESSNLIGLLRTMPPGDWIVTIEFMPDYQTSKDRLYIGLYDNSQKYLSSSVYSDTNYCCDWGNKATTVMLQTKSVNGEKVTKFALPISTPKDRSSYTFVEYIDAYGLNVKTTLQFIKQGRTYYSRLTRDGQIDESGDPVWIKTESVTSLRAPKKLVISAGQWEANEGESLFAIHSVKIEKK
tara:strand:+ start:379835 stop:381163 length:1329 start_codon:yes stop_codon:yes gene_type:complete